MNKSRFLKGILILFCLLLCVPQSVLAEETTTGEQSGGDNTPEVVETYSYNASINAPSTAEDPDFVSGTKVRIVIYDLDANGEKRIWYDSTTESFPVSVNLWNMRSAASGFITLSYIDTIPGETTVDENGDEVVGKGTDEEREIKREIEFVKDE